MNLPKATGFIIGIGIMPILFYFISIQIGKEEISQLCAYCISNNCSGIYFANGVLK